MGRSELVAELMRFLDHQLEQAAPDATVAAATTDAWSPDDLDDIARKRLPELLEKLAEQQPTWNELKDTLSINEVEEFAHAIAELGDAYGYPPLQEWGKRLAAQTELFDIAAMMQTIQGFSGEVDRLQGLIS